MLRYILEEVDEHIDVEYSQAIIKIIVDGSVDIYESLRHETLPEVKNRIIGTVLSIETLMTKVNNILARIDTIEGADDRTLEVTDLHNSLTLSLDYYTREIERLKSKIGYYLKLTIKAKEQKHTTIKINNADDFTKFRSISRLNIEIHNVERNIMRYVIHMEDEDTPIYDENKFFKECKIKELQYKLVKLNILVLFFSKEENILCRSVPLSNERIDRLYEKNEFNSIKLSYLKEVEEYRNLSIQNRETIVKNIKEFNRKINVIELEISLILKHYRSHSVADLDYEIELAIHKFNLTFFQSQSEALIEDSSKSAKDMRTLRDQLNQNDIRLQKTRTKLYLLEVKRRYESAAFFTSDAKLLEYYAREKYLTRLIDEQQQLIATDDSADDSSSDESSGSCRLQYKTSIDTLKSKRLRVHVLIENIITLHKNDFVKRERRHLGLLYTIEVYESRIRCLNMIVENIKCGNYSDVGQETDYMVLNYIDELEEYEYKLSAAIYRMNNINHNYTDLTDVMSLSTCESDNHNVESEDMNIPLNQRKRILEIWSKFPNSNSITTKINKYDNKLQKFKYKLNNIGNNDNSECKINKLNRKITKNMSKLSDLQKIVLLSEFTNKKQFKEKMVKNMRLLKLEDIRKKLDLQISDQSEGSTRYNNSLKARERNRRKINEYSAATKVSYVFGECFSLGCIGSMSSRHTTSRSSLFSIYDEPSSI